MDEALVGGADQLLPVLVDVLAEGGAGLPDLAVDRQLEQVLELVLVEALPDEVELHRRLLDALGEVPLVEGEAELSVLEHVVGARFVISSACGLVHGGSGILAHEGGRRQYSGGPERPVAAKGNPALASTCATGMRSPRGGR